MDYRVKVTIRNNRLLKAMEDKGYPSVRKFSDATGVSYQKAVHLISGKEKPLNEKGELKSFVSNILDLLQLNLEDAFTERQLKGFKRNTFVVEMDETQALQISNPIKTTEAIAMEKDVVKSLKQIIANHCTKNEALVLNYHFFENLPLKDIAKIMTKETIYYHSSRYDDDHPYFKKITKTGISTQRVQQILKKAFSKIAKHKRQLDQAGLHEAFEGLGKSFIYEEVGEGTSKYFKRKDH